MEELNLFLKELEYPDWNYFYEKKDLINCFTQESATKRIEEIIRNLQDNLQTILEYYIQMDIIKSDLDLKYGIVICSIYIKGFKPIFNRNLSIHDSY